jgi:isoleucyl-tRNA synthetase
VHLGDWPTVDAAAVDADLEAAMAAARQLVTLGLAARNEARLNVRQPLRRAYVRLRPGVELSDELAREVADALNVKTLEPVGDLEGLLDYTVVPDFRRLGPRLGPRMPAVKAALAAADGAALRAALARDGRVVLDVDGEAVELGPDDVDVRARAHEELVLAEDAGAAVALDTALDDDLVLEGIARELIRALNDQRKAQGFDLADRIRVALVADGLIADAVERHRAWIADEVLATALGAAPDTSGNGFTPLEVRGEPVRVRLERA